MLASPLLLAAALAACQQGAVLAIDQAGGAVTVAVTRAGEHRPPACVSDLAVYRGDPNGGTPLWHVAAGPEAPCTSRFRIGQVPLDFTADDGAPAPRLESGQRYRVEASGSGFLGTEDFTAR